MNNLDNIEDDDLKGMAPRLSKAGDNNPFKASNDYFDDFAAKIQSRVEGFEEIKIEAPVLSSIPKYNPFEVPANYFDELPTIVQQRCIEKESSVSILEWLMLVIKPRFAVPVITMMFIAFAGINFMNKNAEGPPIEITDEASIEEQLYNIDEATIIETLGASENTDNKSVSSDDNSIENYLIDNHIEESNLHND